MKRKLLVTALILISAFLGWRFIRPLNIFIVTPNFERPIDTSNAPAMFSTLVADECATCHQAFFDEWRTTIHSQAWTDPYFQVDWQFDGSPQICKNCHIPLDRQQEYRVLGFADKEKWQPILAPNPDFNAVLQHEGVTCTACHLRDGYIVGVLDISDAPHPVRKLDNPNRVCVRCHVVEGNRWDTLLRFPPCGTVAEIDSSAAKIPTPEETQRLMSLLNEDERAQYTRTIEARQLPSGPAKPLPAGKVDVSRLGCVDCHMPLVRRPLVPGGKVRSVRQHLWRGGHDPAMVKKALKVVLEEDDTADSDRRHFTLTLINVGAAHYLPTGTPDRHLTVQLRLLDASGKIIRQQDHTLKRTVMWRPFIVDLWDTRLPRWQPRDYTFEFPRGEGVTLEAEVRYHLLDEARRKRIGYKNQTPINYPVYRRSIELGLPEQTSARQRDKAHDKAIT